jgi:hypothetical protein
VRTEEPELKVQRVSKETSDHKDQWGIQDPKDPLETRELKESRAHKVKRENED